jgi:ankyrin repeat protein
MSDMKVNNLRNTQPTIHEIIQYQKELQKKLDGPDLDLLDLIEANSIEEDEIGMTKLHYAAGYGKKPSLKLVKYLLEKSYSVDIDKASDYHGETPLYVAVEYGQLEIVRYLIEKGADIRKRNKEGANPLYQAISSGSFKTQNCSTYVEIAKILLEEGAELDAVVQQHPPLHLAIHSIEMINLLIKHRADVNVKDVYGNTVLDKALKAGYKEIAELLIKHGAKQTTEGKL